MNKALAQARSYGITIELVDLGEWGFDELRSEYDPAGPTIRVNARVLETLSLQELGEYLTFAIGHELYHHREHAGEVQRDPNRAAREAAANAYARALVAES